MKVVIDTNVVVSAIFFGGRPKKLLELLVTRKLEAYASTEIISEYKEPIEELCSQYPRKPGMLPLTIIISSMRILEPTSHIDICRDPDDNKFIECAIDGRCLYIVSGDRDLLSLKKYNDVQIVTVAKFLADNEF